MSSLLKNSIVDIINNYNKFFFCKKNVVGMSLGHKSIKNINTNEPVLRILVREKFPLNEIYKEDMIPKSFFGIKTDVFQVGNLEIKKSHSSLKDNFKELKFLNSRQRPLQGGLSISPINKKYSGTLGAIVFDNETNSPHILSNNHVLAYEGKLPIGNSIVQPSTIDYPFLSIGNKVAKLKNFINLHYKISDFNTLNNYADAAIASINSNVKYTKEIYNIGSVTGTSTANLNKIIRKTGKTTGYTSGLITDTNVLIDIPLDEYVDCTFTNQIGATSMSTQGDSGSLVVDLNNKAIGLLFAASNDVTLINPIDYIIKNLNIHF